MVTSFDLEHKKILKFEIQTELWNTFNMSDYFVSAQFSLKFEIFQTLC